MRAQRSNLGQLASLTGVATSLSPLAMTAESCVIAVESVIASETKQSFQTCVRLIEIAASLSLFAMACIVGVEFYWLREL